MLEASEMPSPDRTHSATETGISSCCGAGQNKALHLENAALGLFGTNPSWGKRY